MKRIAINGFGKIGRAALKIIMDTPDLEVVAITGLMFVVIISGFLHPITAQNVPTSSFKISHDNDALKFKNVTDRDYSFGISANYQQTVKPAFVKFLPTRNFKDVKNKYIGGLEVSLKGYTPTKLKYRLDSLADRPFAGTLTIAPYVVSVNSKRLLKLTLETGVRGPAAQAGEIQNWFHKVIGDDYVSGWDNQLDNKYLINLYLQYAKSFSVFEYLDLIPESSVALGNHLTYLQQGLRFRAGLFNSIDRSTTYSTDLGISDRIEVFASFLAYGRIQVVDATWGNERVLRDDFMIIDKNNLVGGYQAALHFELYRVGVEVSYHKVTPGSNLSIKHSYGNISLRYKW